MVDVLFLGFFGLGFSVWTRNSQARRLVAVTSQAGGSCWLLPLLHVLIIDLASVDTVDRLCSRLRTAVDSTGSGEQTPEAVVRVLLETSPPDAASCCAWAGLQAEGTWWTSGAGNWSRGCSRWSMLIALYFPLQWLVGILQGRCPYLVDSPFWDRCSVRVAWP